MSWIAGIDVDTKAIHIVVIDEESDDDKPHYAKWELHGHDAWERVRSVREVMRGMDWSDCLAIGIESPAGRAGTGLYAVIRTTGAVLACLPTRTLVQPWRPGEWRKAVGLAGNCSKDDVRLYVARTIPVGHDAMPNNSPILNGTWPQDACDAYCIALATRAALVRPAEAAA